MNEEMTTLAVSSSNGDRPTGQENTEYEASAGIFCNKQSVALKPILQPAGSRLHAKNKSTGSVFREGVRMPTTMEVTKPMPRGAIAMPTTPHSNGRYMSSGFMGTTRPMNAKAIPASPTQMGPKSGAFHAWVRLGRRMEGTCLQVPLSDVWTYIGSDAATCAAGGGLIWIIPDIDVRPVHIAMLQQADGKVYICNLGGEDDVILIVNAQRHEALGADESLVQEVPFHTQIKLGAVTLFVDPREHL